jgi:hypothetical protein
MVVPEKKPISVRLSIGIAVFPDHGRTGTAVLEIADQPATLRKRWPDTFR